MAEVPPFKRHRECLTAEAPSFERPHNCPTGTAPPSRGVRVPPKCPTAKAPPSWSAKGPTNAPQQCPRRGERGLLGATEASWLPSMPAVSRGREPQQSGSVMAAAPARVSATAAALRSGGEIVPGGCGHARRL